MLNTANSIQYVHYVSVRDSPLFMTYTYISPISNTVFTFGTCLQHGAGDMAHEPFQWPFSSKRRLASCSKEPLGSSAA